MRTRYNLVIHVSVIFLLFLFNNYSSAYNLRQYSSKNGLSNSAVLSICQDGDGFMWFGSCEGVNFFDGLNFQLYNPIDKKKILSGNIVESILEAENNICGFRPIMVLIVWRSILKRYIHSGSLRGKTG